MAKSSGGFNGGQMKVYSGNRKGSISLPAATAQKAKPGPTGGAKMPGNVPARPAKRGPGAK